MKKNSFKFTALSVATSMALALTGCGGDDNSHAFDSHHSVEATGQFIDAAVANLDVYQNGKKIDTTDAEGMFTYMTGSEVTFKLGALTLGSTEPKAIITPADLSPNPDNVVEILQVLQSLDEDKNPENGIFIPQTTLDKLVTALDLSEDDVSIADTVSKDIPDLTLESELDAVEHFTQSQEKLEASDNLSRAAGKLEGYWYLSECDEGTKSIMEMDKVTDNSVQVVGGLVNKYADNSCTGDAVSTSSYIPDEDEIMWTVVGTPNSNTINVLFENDYDNQQSIPPYLASIQINGDMITIDSQPTDETYSLLKLDSLAFPDKQALEDAKLSILEGYWKSDCIESTNGSKIYYLNNVAQADGTILVKQSLREDFTGNVCSGNGVVTINEEGVGMTIPKSDIENMELEDNNTFIAGGHTVEVYNRISEDEFPEVTENSFESLVKNVAQNGHIVEDGSETLDEFINDRMYDDGYWRIGDSKGDSPYVFTLTHNNMVNIAKRVGQTLDPVASQTYKRETIAGYEVMSFTLPDSVVNDLIPEHKHTTEIYVETAQGVKEGGD